MTDENPYQSSPIAAVDRVDPRRPRPLSFFVLGAIFAPFVLHFVGLLGIQYSRFKMNEDLLFASFTISIVTGLGFILCMPFSIRIRAVISFVYLPVVAYALFVFGMLVEMGLFGRVGM